MNKHIKEVLVKRIHKDQIWYEVISIENFNASKEQITLVRGSRDFKPSGSRNLENSDWQHG